MGTYEYIIWRGRTTPKSLHDKKAGRERARRWVAGTCLNNYVQGTAKILGTPRSAYMLARGQCVTSCGPRLKKILYLNVAMRLMPWVPPWPHTPLRKWTFSVSRLVCGMNLGHVMPSMNYGMRLQLVSLPRCMSAHSSVHMLSIAEDVDAFHGKKCLCSIT